LYICVFFFQAEDGIRDFHVTGVQTCALPIYIGLQSQQPLLRVAQGTTRNPSKCFPGPRAVRYSKCLPILGGVGITIHVGFNLRRSEERRVGTEGGARGSTDSDEEETQCECDH